MVFATYTILTAILNSFFFSLRHVDTCYVSAQVFDLRISDQFVFVNHFPLKTITFCGHSLLFLFLPFHFSQWQVWDLLDPCHLMFHGVCHRAAALELGHKELGYSCNSHYQFPRIQHRRISSLDSLRPLTGFWAQTPLGRVTSLVVGSEGPPR